MPSPFAPHANAFSVEEALRHRLALESTLLEVSQCFASRSEVDLTHVLGILGTAFQACRAFLFQLRPDGLVDNTHEWCAEGMPPQIDDSQGLDPANFPWMLEMFQRGEVVAFSGQDNLPQEAASERAFLSALNIESALCLPIADRQGTLRGFIGFDNDNRRHTWSDDDIRVFRVAARFIGDYLDHRRLEAEAERHRRQLAQADRLAALGILVSGVAHEVNNPLGVILLDLPLLEKLWRALRPTLEARFQAEGDFLLSGLPYQELRDQLPCLLQESMDAARRIKRIVTDLSDFARPGPPEIQERLDLNGVVQAACRLLATPLRKATDHLEVTLLTGLPPVRGDFQRLEQVAVNLILNACQALTDASEAIRIRTRVQGGMVVLEVQDEGVGIPPEHLPHLLEPFFTTKRDQGGTGLGLAISAGIASEHAGRLEISSQPGLGTRVTLTLPQADRQRRSDARHKEEPVQPGETLENGRPIWRS